MTESCHRTAYNYTTKTDEYQSKSLTWECVFKSFPDKVGESVSSSCRPEVSSHNSRDYTPDTDPFARLMRASEATLSGLKNDTFVAKLTLSSVEEDFAANLCTPDKLSKRKIIKISQGLDSFSGEDDFLITIRIGGVERDIKLRRKSAVLNDEIAICTDDVVNISFDAVEEDWIWDDQYYCAEGSAKEVNLSLKKSGSNVGYMRFNRGGMLAKFFDKDQEVKFELIDSPVK